jgi:hypothetical protein
MYQERDQSDPESNLAGRSVKWVVDEVSNESSETPIVARILEDVEQRHRLVAKSVHKNGFVNSFDVVTNPAQTSNTAR